MVNHHKTHYKKKPLDWKKAIHLDYSIDGKLVINEEDI